MLDTEVVPTNPKVKGQATRCFPAILEICAELVIAVTAGECRWIDGKRNGAAWSGVVEINAWEFALGIDRSLELCELAIQEILNTRVELRGTERLYRFLVGTEGAVVADVSIVAAEADSVPPVGRTQILICLDEILRAAKRNGVARSERRIARHSD